MPAMPPALAAAIVALTNAVLSVVINFGINLTEDQRVSIVGLTNAVLVFAAILWHVFRPDAGRPSPPGP